MLAGDDMIKMESRKRQMALVNVTIFATEARPLPNLMARLSVHQAADDGFCRRRALACKMATKLPNRTYVSYSTRSSGVNAPSSHLSASSSIRACSVGSARRFKSAASPPPWKQRLNGSSNRSTKGRSAAVRLMAQRYHGTTRRVKEGMRIAHASRAPKMPGRERDRI